jgi:hypothetical protein
MKLCDISNVQYAGISSVCCVTGWDYTFAILLGAEHGLTFEARTPVNMKWETFAGLSEESAASIFRVEANPLGGESKNRPKM